MDMKLNGFLVKGFLLLGVIVALVPITRDLSILLFLLSWVFVSRFIIDYTLTVDTASTSNVVILTVSHLLIGLLTLLLVGTELYKITLYISLHGTIFLISMIILIHIKKSR